MNAETRIVDVAMPGGAYAIHIGAGMLGRFGGLLRELSAATRVTVVTDENVGPLYAAAVAESLRGADFGADVLTCPAGDESKSLAQAARLYDELARIGHGRDEPIVALGGGMIGDLAGFVAATWMRGVPFVQCPTTLEADVDAAVGGKTAVNHAGGKNLIGAFHQPVLVCVDTTCLGTLPERDFVAGLAESVKHGLISDETFFNWQEANAVAIRGRDAALLPELIELNCRIKATVVAADEREQATAGVGRAALNVGHTIGHAIEAASRYRLRHGEAVALGLVAELEIATRLAGFPEEDRGRCEGLLQALGLPIRIEDAIDANDVVRRLGMDKKNRGGRVRMVVPTRIGEVRWLDAPSEQDVWAGQARIGVER